jgi:hypothetical protein
MGASYRVCPSSSEDETGLDVSNAPDENIQSLYIDIFYSSFCFDI